jgi:dTDP-4-amino-4,6-dideoxygalactose transaminase
MKVPFNDLYSQHESLLSQFIYNLEQGIKESAFILGSDVQEFENRFAEWGNFQYVVGVANGSDAIRISLSELGVSQGDKVLVAANSYFAAPAAVAQLKAIPVFIDVELSTRFPSKSNFDVNNHTEIKGIIRSHLFGGADIAELPYNLDKRIQIHDSSQAHGTLVNGKHIGVDGTATFSFYPGKNLGAMGDAGAITTTSKDLYSKLLKSRNQGTGEDKYLHETLGSNSRLDSLQARILSIKLQFLNDNNILRTNIVNRYRENIGQTDSRLKFFNYAPNITPSHHLLQIRVTDVKAKNLIEYLKSKNIMCGQHYPIPLHLQPAFQFLNYAKGDFPNCEKLANETLSLPLYPAMTNTQIDFVSENILEYLAKN